MAEQIALQFANGLPFATSMTLHHYGVFLDGWRSGSPPTTSKP
jgi:hypothetical protein